MENKERYLKLIENFFDTKELKIIESMPNGFQYSNLLIKLYLLAIRDNFILQLDDNTPYTTDMIASITRCPVDVVNEALKVFEELGLIGYSTGGAICLKAKNIIG